MNVVRLKEQRNDVISDVENVCDGSSESVLPAIFFQDIDELDAIQLVKLQIYIDMYNVGKTTALHMKV